MMVDVKGEGIQAIDTEACTRKQGEHGCTVHLRSEGQSALENRKNGAQGKGKECGMVGGKRGPSKLCIGCFFERSGGGEEGMGMVDKRIRE